MSKTLLQRLTSTSPSIRYYQVTNGVINAIFGKSLGITHLAEYPRCGGTWIRHLLQDSMGIQQYAYDRMLSKGTIIQCHVLPNSMIHRAIVIFRDPRDATVSLYHKKVSYDNKFRNGERLSIGRYTHDPNRDPQDDFFQFLQAFLSNPDHPRFSFGEFARQWSSKTNTCIAKYEDFKSKPIEELRRLTHFLGVSVTDEKLEAAVEKNSFANRTKQRSGVVRKPGESDNNQFERKGIVGDWRNLFNQDAKDLFAKHEGETLVSLGYESDQSWTTAPAETNAQE